MAKLKKYSPQQKRRVEGKTDYRNRLGLLKSGKPRFVVRKSSRSIICQIIMYSPDGDKVIASAHSNELIKLGWKLDKKNTMSAYLVGFLLGKKAKKSKISEAILDIGVYTSTKGARVYAEAKGARDAGLQLPLDERIAPDQNRIRGKHIESYAQSLKGDKEKFQRQFSKYLKEGIDPTKVSAYFEETKKKIEGA